MGGSATILRLFRGTAPRERADDVAAALAGPFIEAARSMTGLTSYAGGLRVETDAVRFIVVTTWRTFDALTRETGGRPDRPAVQAPDFMATDAVDHYELVGEPSPIHVSTPDALVRVARMVVKPNAEETYYGLVRRGLEELRPTGNLLAYHLGRRVEADRHVAAAVSVWRSAAALGEIVEPGSDQPLWSDEMAPLLDCFEVEHFDAVLVGPS